MVKRNTLPLPQRIPSILPHIRRRGEDYFRSGRVTIEEVVGGWISAEVQGSSLYAVELSAEGSEIEYLCTCPYYERDGDVCQHVWATVLEADRRGAFDRDLHPSGRIELLPFVDLDLPSGDSGDDAESEEDDPLDILDRLISGEQRDEVLSPRSQPATPGWEEALRTLRRASTAPDFRSAALALSEKRQVIYVIDPAATVRTGMVQVEVRARKRRADGSWKDSKPFSILRHTETLPSPVDRRIASLLAECPPPAPTSVYEVLSYRRTAYDGARNAFSLSGEGARQALDLLGATGRLFIDDEHAREVGPLTLDDGPPWEFRLALEPQDAEKAWRLEGYLRRAEDEIPLSAPRLLLEGGWVFLEDRVARLDHHQAFEWIRLLRETGAIAVPFGEEERLLERLSDLPRLPPVRWPEALRVEEHAAEPRPHLRILEPENDTRKHPRLRLELGFRYDGAFVRARDPRRLLYQRDERRVIRRRPEAEEVALETLLELGCRVPPGYVETMSGEELPQELELPPRKLDRLVRELVRREWQVEADGKLYRRAKAIRIEVKSGIDWFDVEGGVDFDGEVVPLPRLLESVRRGSPTVVLDDGTHGILPDEWLERYGILLGTGTAEEDAVRFRRSQAGIVDQLCGADVERSWDETFERVRAELCSFEGIRPSNAPRSFRGKLRGYQKEGLGWLEFLERFGFGGCLADDMGLGKTVQVLALLEKRRVKRVKEKSATRPSLVVAPRSLVFNWRSEAARFTPRLRVLDHTGLGRVKEASHLEGFDLVLTTYGTLRRDIDFLEGISFDLAVLDEAQAIKNAESESARAARRLAADHRLALSGTPIENHLGELWSLFEFLNPGMLGTVSVFRRLVGGNGGNGRTKGGGPGGAALQRSNGEAGELSGNGANGAPARAAPNGGGPRDGRRNGASGHELLARACRPFILRRTKQEVVRDLPEKIEQTVVCDLGRKERKLYDELRDYYRTLLRRKVETVGLGRAKIQVLEALLRLRQAACHPGLVDRARTKQPSAKLDLLIEQLQEVVEEGHKALVFSQFTRFLGIVRERLDALGVAYEYLDGRTRDREAKVRKFQEDPETRLFLISLKAGGVGLNLTAAEYVFLLDPWWNPAVEAQAIDRAHRIGQANRVIAYRLIAKDTVEERVLELQESKRDLARSILEGSGSVVRDLSSEDLELLLS